MIIDCLAAEADRLECQVPGSPFVFGIAWRELFVTNHDFKHPVNRANMEVHMLVQVGAQVVNESHCADDE